VEGVMGERTVPLLARHHFRPTPRIAGVRPGPLQQEASAGPA
jgi:hypothetical protein